MQHQIIKTKLTKCSFNIHQTYNFSLGDLFCQIIGQINCLPLIVRPLRSI